METTTSLTTKLDGFYKQKKASKTFLNVVEPVKVHLGSTIIKNSYYNEYKNEEHFGY